MNVVSQQIVATFINPGFNVPAYLYTLPQINMIPRPVTFY